LCGHDMGEAEACMHVWHARRYARRSFRAGREPQEGNAMTTVAELDTPVITVDLDRVENNIRRAQEHLSKLGLANRPHIKTHKIPALAKKQIDAGAVGITCQKLGEVEVMADAGVADDILLTFNVVGEAKTERLAALIKRLKRMAVVLDNEAVAKGLSEAGRRHGVDIRFLIECDTGFGRNGVQSPQAALDLARAAMRMPHMQFEGLMTFPTAKPEQRQWLERALQLLQGAGIDVPVVSGGGSPSLKSAGDFPMLTEYRAGTYIYNDVMQVTSGAATWDDCALTVRATVVSRPTEDRAILDAGSKVMTYEQYYAKGFGRIVEYPDADVTGFSEEHGMVDLKRSAKKPKVGEVVRVIPNHCCVVTNMMDEVYGVRGDQVEVMWPVAARGKVR
jgi:D-serine deaminase-like pyridoxal phosphate-dependent protein